LILLVEDEISDFHISFLKKKEKESFQKFDHQAVVDFVNVLHACFLYESASSSFSLVTFWRKSTFV
jgi:hypothetical protein